MSEQPIRRALISVSDKSGLVDFAQALADRGVALISTGGSARALREAGLPVTEVAEVTGFPEIMDGRVKTLHPGIHGGILARRDEESHLAAMRQHGLQAIDLVVVNLYPFRETVARGAPWADCIENIDIGGPALIRAAAKNHDFVTIVTDPEDYGAVLADMERLGGATDLATRRRLAQRAFAHTAGYDSAIASWMSRQAGEDLPDELALSAKRVAALRYGENPHQAAAVYSDGSDRPGVVTARQLQGKELSYNNLNDTDAAYELVAEFARPAVAIIKHANPCGVAEAESLEEAYRKALACDPVSAYGGILAVNRPLDAATVEALEGLFLEVIIAPAIDPAAAAALESRRNLRVLDAGGLPDAKGGPYLIKSLAGGLLLQERDSGQVDPEELETVTERAPDARELADLLFAWRVVKHVKSNAIVFAKEGATVGMGAGQTSRVDAARLAAQKSVELIGVEASKGAVVASDAFFPFADGLRAAIEAGCTAVIQPGGSVRDEEVVAAANQAGLAMVVTGMRHFRH